MTVENPLHRFLTADGRVAIWPSKRRNRLLILAHLANVLEFGRSYTEREVNVLLREAHTWNDPAFLRHMLFQERYLDRMPDGARYWRLSQPAVDD